jgi:hypothetical protein
VQGSSARTCLSTAPPMPSESPYVSLSGSYGSIEINSTVKMSVAPGGIDPCPFGP